MKYSDHTIDLKFIKDDGIIFDIGAYRGDFTGSLLKDKPDCKYYLYEPQRKELTIKRRFKDVDNVTINYKGISNSSENKTLYIGHRVGPDWIKTTASSFHPDNIYIGPHKYEVECCTIEEEFNKYGIKEVEVMKINVEGEEVNILMDTPIDILKKIKQFTISWHLHCKLPWYTKKLVDECRSRLTDNGFKEVLWSDLDSLYIRKDLL